MKKKFGNSSTRDKKKNSVKYKNPKLKDVYRMEWSLVMMSELE